VSYWKPVVKRLLRDLPITPSKSIFVRPTGVAACRHDTSVSLLHEIPLRSADSANTPQLLRLTRVWQSVPPVRCKTLAACSFKFGVVCFARVWFRFRGVVIGLPVLRPRYRIVCCRGGRDLPAAGNRVMLPVQTVVLVKTCRSLQVTIVLRCVAFRVNQGRLDAGRLLPVIIHIFWSDLSDATHRRGGTDTTRTIRGVLVYRCRGRGCDEEIPHFGWWRSGRRSHLS